MNKYTGVLSISLIIGIFAIYGCSDNNNINKIGQPNENKNTQDYVTILRNTMQTEYDLILQISDYDRQVSTNQIKPQELITVIDSLQPKLEIQTAYVQGLKPSDKYISLTRDMAIEFKNIEEITRSLDNDLKKGDTASFWYDNKRYTNELSNVSELTTKVIYAD